MSGLEPTAIVGVILAGGRATRMGGGDKGLLPLGGARLMDRVIARLRPQVESLAINANGDVVRLAEFALPLLPDPVDGHAGPLAGVLAGMEWAAAEGASHVATVAADSPFFPDDLVTRLADALTPDRPIALAATPDGRQPTFGLWPVDLRVDLRDSLAAGTRKVVAFTDRHGTALARFEDAAAFFNVNTPDDLAAAERML